ncbi:MAG: NAD(+)/NADH kinase [Acidobacteria bacterium]|nr:NAD(+)/NADH kinase [Acidobacteriota bacterium]
MRVTIIHNPESGEKALTGPDLIATVRAAGHHATYASTADQPAVAKLLADPGDLVAIVGGDGTMRNVATRLIGRDVPVTLVPTGTANNIGRTLGIAGEAFDLIAGWSAGRFVAFDSGIVRGSTHPCPLIEGMGFGPIAVTIAALSPLTEAEASAEWTTDEVRRDLKVLREVLADYPVHECRVTLDGHDLSGEYILVEAMNIRSVGPNVALAPDADVSDGMFDLVLLTDAHREALRDYLTARLDGAEPALRVPAHRGRHVELSWKGSRVHIDDQVWPNERDASSGRVWSRDGRVELEVLMNPSALQVLVPAAPAGGPTASPN